MGAKDGLIHGKGSGRGVKAGGSFTAALRRAAELKPRRDSNETRLEALARRVWAIGLETDDPKIALQAAQFIAERLEGKPKQSIDMDARQEITFVEDRSVGDPEALAAARVELSAAISRGAGHNGSGRTSDRKNDPEPPVRG